MQKRRVKNFVAFAMKSPFTASIMKGLNMPTGLPDFELERFLPYRITVVAARLSAELSAQYKTQFGISVPEWRVLLNVGYSPSTSVRDIESRVNLEKSKVSRAASKLEAKGLLSKEIDTNDRRLIKLEVTKQGAELLRQIIPIAKEYQAELSKTLGDETHAFYENLDKLLERAD
jgi:DNA-binding MarR family transcriptional regulator